MTDEEYIQNKLLMGVAHARVRSLINWHVVRLCPKSKLNFLVYVSKNDNIRERCYITQEYKDKIIFDDEMSIAAAADILKLYEFLTNE